MSSSQSFRTTCSGCGRPVAEMYDATSQLRAPCPSCGSQSRTVHALLTATAEAHAFVKAVQTRPGRKNPVSQIESGDSLYRKTGRWSKLHRVIDWAQDWYSELITDKETGEVHRECHEPLSAHIGRGTPRRLRDDLPSN